VISFRQWPSFLSRERGPPPCSWDRRLGRPQPVLTLEKRKILILPGIEPVVLQIIIIITIYNMYIQLQAVKTFILKWG
jgi:hypothetical protein